MTLKYRPGTRAHRAALYRAACDYQDGESLERSARRNRVNPMTLRYYMKQVGWKIHTDRKYRGPATRVEIPDALLDAYPRSTLREIADAAGVSKTTVRKRLIERGTYTPTRPGVQETTRWANSLRNRTRVLRAVELRERGLTHGQIAIKLGVPRSTVGTYLRLYRSESYLWQREPVPSWWVDAE